MRTTRVRALAGPDERVDERKQEVDQKHGDSRLEVERKEVILLVVAFGFERLVFVLGTLLGVVDTDMERGVSLGSERPSAVRTGLAG